MNWQETILTREQCIELWAGVDEDPFDDFQRIATAQAEASYKTGYEEGRKGCPALEVQGQIYLEGKQDGIREVVEWVEDNRLLLYDPTYEDREEWRAKLKEWGIAEGQ